MRRTLTFNLNIRGNMKGLLQAERIVSAKALREE